MRKIKMRKTGEKINFKQDESSTIRNIKIINRKKKEWW